MLRCFFIILYQECLLSMSFLTVILVLNIWMIWCLSGFSHKVTLVFSAFHALLFRSKSHPTFKMWGIMTSYFNYGIVYIIYLEFFSMGGFTPFIYLIIYLYKYVLMNTYFVIWVIIQLQTLLFILFAQSIPALNFMKTVLVGTCAPLTYPDKVCFCALSYFLLLPDALDSSYICFLPHS